MNPAAGFNFQGKSLEILSIARSVEEKEAPGGGFRGAGAGDETRTRDVLLGKEVLYH